jgi:Protein of unknown function (DUF3300)
VPVYDTRVVYGSWWWPSYQPVFWHYPSSYVFVGGFYWGPRAHIGPNYFYSSVHWRQRSLVVVNYRNTYATSPHFYTGRSIINYSDARPWRHNPVHRHGVAYYNNRLSVTYGSHRTPYQNSHRGHERKYDHDYLNRHPEHNRSRSNGVQFNQGIEHRNVDVIKDNRTPSPQDNVGNIDRFNDAQDKNHRNNNNHTSHNNHNNHTSHNNHNNNQTNTESRPAWESNGQHNRLQAGSDQQSTRTQPDNSRSRPEVHVDNQVNRRIEGGRSNPPRRGRDDDKDK